MATLRARGGRSKTRRAADALTGVANALGQYVNFKQIKDRQRIEDERYEEEQRRAGIDEQRRRLESDRTHALNTVTSERQAEKDKRTSRAAGFAAKEKALLQKGAEGVARGERLKERLHPQDSLDARKQQLGEDRLAHDRDKLNRGPAPSKDKTPASVLASEYFRQQLAGETLKDVALMPVLQDIMADESLAGFVLRTPTDWATLMNAVDTGFPEMDKIGQAAVASTMIKHAAELGLQLGDTEDLNILKDQFAKKSGGFNLFDPATWSPASATANGGGSRYVTPESIAGSLKR